MTPQIALDLSLDGIVVMSRADDGTWWREGIVRLDADNMAEQLTRMRARCAARVGEEFTTLLIIPDSQILFTSLERDDRDPKVTIRSLLRGRTPYEVEDLAFDYIQRGDRLQVAVVALETLLEAESFAAGFGFRPVALVANPQDSTYPGLPRFGQTGLASDLLAGEKLDLDIEDGFEIVPAPNAPEMPEEEVAAAPEPEEPPAAEPVAEDAPVEAGPAEVATDDAPPAEEPPAPETPEPVTVEDAPAEESAAPEEAAAIEAVPSDDTPADAGPEDAMPVAAPPPEAPTPVPPAARAAPVAAEDAPQKPETPPLATPAAPAFSTKRRGEPVMSAPKAEPLARITPRLSATPPVVATPAPAETPSAEPATVTLSEAAPARPGSGALAGLMGVLRRDATQGDAPDEPEADPDASALALPGLARERVLEPRRRNGKLGLALTLSLLALMGIVALWAVLLDDDPATDVAGDAPATSTPEATALLLPEETPEDAPVPQEEDLASLLPTPRPESPETPATAPEVVSPPLPLGGDEEARETAEAEPPAETPDTEAPEAVAEAPQPPVEAETTEDAAADTEATEPETETAELTPEGPVTESALPDAAEETTEAPAESEGGEEIAAVDPAPEDSTLDATATAEAPAETPAPVGTAAATAAAPEVESAALPEAGTETAALDVTPQPDAAPAEDAAPATEDAGAELAAAGDDTPPTAPAATTDAAEAPDAEAPPAEPEIELVTATPEGTAAPGGYTVVAGRPDVMPVARVSTRGAVETPEAAPEETAERTALRRVLPTQRPAREGTDAETAGESDDAPLAGGLSREELTRVRPRQRPEDRSGAAAETGTTGDDTDAAVQAAAAAAAASLAQSAEAPPPEPVSRLALASSDRPSGRPRSVERAAARIVTQRREQATAAAASSSSQSSSPAPAAARSGQTIRSAGGSVARAATQRNAIRLRDTNLIGVYGRPNARRALVRLSNGRYVKVEVGDRLNRGRVTAIGDSQLVYQRGGRNVTLRLPRS
ncbi:hypothetical protein [Jannaschia marina]|uniref:hypothetical protein n=1 Tax=Jannaschia marina TaxID=2741674 RepID=UPI0015C983F8|nr:hypothetical protein [Jannaschia marina]